MFGAHGVVGIVWKHMDNDFVLGACSRQIIGFATLDSEGQWAAFDGDSAPLASFGALDDAKAALRAAHGATHARDCETPTRISAWTKRVGRMPLRIR